MKLQIIEFMNNNENWEEILAKPPYSIKTKRDGDYILLKYDQLNSDFNLKIVRECRGIIITFRDSKYIPVAVPFFKFGNYGESYVPEIDWKSAVVQEKLDGSLIKFWYDDDEWHISTNGTIDAFKALVDGSERSFGDLVIEAMPIPWEDFGTFASTSATYMFELCSKYNRVVVPYNEPQLYFLGWRCNNYELKRSSSIFNDIFLTPKTYDLHSLDDTVAAAKALPWNEEGYVVCDKYFNRIKIKSPEYVKAHYARNNNTMTTERFVDIVLKGEQSEFLLYAEEWERELMKVQTAMRFFARSAREALAGVFEMKDFENRGQYAAAIKDEPRMMQDFLFHCFNEQIFWDYAKKWSAADWVKAITPILESKGF